ncbi:hypothetical protein [Thiohalorhabdus methylotrophus]|uniref:Uncharacterized protein n=1 Tax=Thiohalorhabdus methylotrophus TaxID=3242694 RepID=A0ABV4TSH6_9GAMM
MRTLILLAALLVALPATAAPAGIPLWEDAYTGMSPEEILRFFPEAQRTSPDQRAKKGPEGGEELVRIPRVQIAGDPYRGHFYFRDGRLERVVLELIPQGEMTFSEGLKKTEKVRDALSRKYGEPTKRTSSGEGYKVDWDNGRTDIHLMVITKSYKVKQFDIVYEAGSDG